MRPRGEGWGRAGLRQCLRSPLASRWPEPEPASGLSHPALLRTPSLPGPLAQPRTRGDRFLKKGGAHHAILEARERLCIHIIALYRLYILKLLESVEVVRTTLFPSLFLFMALDSQIPLCFSVNHLAFYPPCNNSPSIRPPCISWVLSNVLGSLMQRLIKRYFLFVCMCECHVNGITQYVNLTFCICQWQLAYNVVLASGVQHSD